jgi:hypothetical protein
VVLECRDPGQLDLGRGSSQLCAGRDLRLRDWSERQFEPQPGCSLNFQGATVTLGDTSPPNVTVGGTLFSAGWRHPADVATFNTSDNSGIKQARLEADGRVLQSTAYPCNRTLPVPCRAAMAGKLNPRGITDGAHTIRVVTLDAAGNSGVAQRQVQVDATPPTAMLERARGKTIVVAVSDTTSGVASAAIEVRNGSKEPFRTLVGTLADGKLRAKLDRGSASRVEMRVTARDAAGNVTQGNPSRLFVTSAKFGRRTRRVHSNRVKVPFGRRATLHGRLTLSGDQPLTGQTIGVASTVRRRGARAQLVGAAKTNSRGRFAMRIPAGPSRTLRFAFAGGGGALGSTRGISYRVPASSTIHASRTRLSGSGRVRFSGRLRTRGQPVPARGLLLVLQGRERGRCARSTTREPTARAAGTRRTTSAAAPAATRSACASGTRAATRSSSATRAR